MSASKEKHPAWKDEWAPIRWTVAVSIAGMKRAFNASSLSAALNLAINAHGKRIMRPELVLVFRYGVLIPRGAVLDRLFRFVELKWQKSLPTTTARRAKKQARHTAELAISETVFFGSIRPTSSPPKPIEPDPFEFLLADFRKKKLSKARNRLTQPDDKA